MDTNFSGDRNRKPASAQKNLGARQLLQRLDRFKGKNLVVLASSQGAIDLAKDIAKQLKGDWDVLQVKKLVDKKNRIVGSVSETGGVFLSQEAQNRGVTEEMLSGQIVSKIAEMQATRVEKEMVSPEGKLVIIADTDSQSGYRLLGALSSLRTLIPKHIVLATPELSHRAFAVANPLCDEIIALNVTSPKTAQ